MSYSQIHHYAGSDTASMDFTPNSSEILPFPSDELKAYLPLQPGYLWKARALDAGSHSVEQVHDGGTYDGLPDPGSGLLIVGPDGAVLHELSHEPGKSASVPGSAAFLSARAQVMHELYVQRSISRSDVSERLAELLRSAVLQ